MSQISVLIVEDDPDYAAYVEKLLGNSRYRFEHAENLASAHQLIQGNTFDLVLLDLSVTDLQDIETCISVIEYAADLPIIALSELDDETLALATLRLGAQDYVVKQALSESTLSRSIRFAMERKSAEMEIRKNANSAKLAESQAREVSARLSLALKAAGCGVWSWDVVNDTLEVSSDTVSMFEINKGKALNCMQDALDTIVDEDRESVKDAINKTVTDRTDYCEEYRTLKPDGTIRYVASWGQVVEEPATGRLTLVGISTDITRRKKEQENAKRLLLLEQHEDFISTLTHDLKNPIISANRILRMFIDGGLGELQDEQRKLLKLVNESNIDMLTLIQNLLEVYRIDEGHTLRYSHFNVADLVTECIGQLVTINNDCQVDVHFNFANGGDQIEADRTSVQRVLINLVDNALKFTAPGGIITISGHADGDAYCIVVEDTGLGIAVSEVNALFRRFSQAESGKKNSSGTGLGLYLCRKLVEAHGGQISCKSEEGVGTTFTIVLPRGRTAELINPDRTEVSLSQYA